MKIIEIEFETFQSEMIILYLFPLKIVLFMLHTDHPLLLKVGDNLIQYHLKSWLIQLFHLQIEHQMFLNERPVSEWSLLDQHQPQSDHLRLGHNIKLLQILPPKIF